MQYSTLCNVIFTQFLCKNLLLGIQAYQKKREDHLISEVEASIIYKIFRKLASESLQTIDY